MTGAKTVAAMEAIGDISDWLLWDCAILVCALAVLLVVLVTLLIGAGLRAAADWAWPLVAGWWAERRRCRGR